MKNRKKALSLLLCLAMLGGIILPALPAVVPFAHAEEPVTSWDNGDLLGQGLCNDYNAKHKFLSDPFSYAYWYQGSDPEDARDAGFYDMIIADCGNDEWPKGYYFCGTVAESGTENQRNSFHQAAGCAPTYHYSPGIAFTAPYAGKVKFVYQYAGLDGTFNKFTFYVMRDSASGYDDALHSYKATKVVASGSDGGEYDEVTLEIEVSQDEVIYFVADNTENGHMVAHWIKSAAYEVEYTLGTDKTEYEAGEAIKVTASANPGDFGSSDKIKLINAENTVVSEQAAAAEVTFSDISAGNYKVALYHGDTEVKSVDSITVKATVEPDPEDGYGDLTARCGDENGKNRNFYPDDAPISYAFYYQGTEPNDTDREAGFYPMVKANNGDSWSNGFYNCALNAGETGYARVSTIHQAASCAPSYHYSPGFVYTAPETGMVEFVYQYTWLDGPPATDSDKMTFYVMRETATGYGDALYSYKPQKSVSGWNGNGDYDEVTIKLNVTKGEKVYFVADNAKEESMVAHWIKSAEYVADPTYTLTTDKDSYTAGDTVTVTTTVSEGGFSVQDTIRVSKGGAVIAEKPAAGTVTFSGLSAGSYQVALIRGGNAVQPKDITVAPDPNATSWDNGDIMDHYKNNKSFYTAGTPFGYAFYYEGTEPGDSRAKGFYPMIISENNDGWSHGFYFCAANSGETGCPRVSTIHQAAANAPTWHYSPGMVFTAPKTGTVEFTYQFAKAYGGGGCGAHRIFVLRDVKDPYENGAIATYPLTATLYGEGEGASGTPETQTIKVNVTQGEKIYFVIDNQQSNDGMSAHWIKSARYLETTPTYTVTTDKASYTESDPITVTATVSEGGFSATDKLQLVGAGNSVKMEKPAAGTVTFTPTAQELPAGSYQVTLVHGGLAVATKEITVTAAATPGPATSWNNGSMLEDGRLKTDAGKHKFLSAPFGYAFFYEGTDPDDTRLYGFHDMVLSSAGAQDWPKGFYACSPNAGSGTQNQLGALHQAAATASTFHYSPGIVFTAPYTGTVKFVYQYAGLDGIIENKFTFYVMRDSAASYSEAIGTYTPAKVASSNPNVEDVGECTEVELTVPVTKGEKIYFVVNQDISEGGGMVAHWIKSAEYVKETVQPTYTLNFDKSFYREGNTLTLNASVFGGTFQGDTYTESTLDSSYTVRLDFLSDNSISFEGRIENGKVTFTPVQESEQMPGEAGELAALAAAAEGETEPEVKWSIPAGEYKATLLHGEQEVATAQVRIIGDEIPTGQVWEYGDLLTHYKSKHTFTYDEGSPISYAFYYQGTDPDDTGRAAGFYPMIKAENADKAWPHGFYDCALEAGELDGPARVKTIHEGATAAPSYHYSPGYCFTAPETGTVEFTYQFAKAYGGGGCENHVIRVLRGDSVNYTNAIATYTPTATLTGEGIGTTGTPQTVTLTVNDVTAGDKIYFLIDNTANGGMTTHWIKSFRYVPYVPPAPPAPSRGTNPAKEEAYTTPTGIAWSNGDLAGAVKNKQAFYHGDTPFGYAFFYEGTDPEDPRLAGFYDMVLAEAGDQNWPKGFYACGLTADEVKDGVIDNRLNTLQQAAANAPTYHYSPGIVFTAPYTGTVEFLYQYAGLDSVEDKFTFYVMRDSAAVYGDAVASYKPTKAVSSANGSGGYDEARLELHVTKGEKIYFVTDSTSNGHMCAHWLKAAGYLSIDPSFTLETDKDRYVEEEAITVSSSVTDGEFGAEDTIRIFRVDETKAVQELPVGKAVTFTPSVERMPAGNYRVALIHQGEEVLSRDIQIIGRDVPAETFWDNGDITEHCKNKHDFYGPDTPFGYAFFYEGTDPEDPRFAGFYDMVMAEAGDQDWPKGFYACGLTGTETKDGVIDNRLNTLHQSVANAPTYHYSPGVVFTAPYTGTVEFVYQYAGLDGVEDKFTFYVMRDSAMSYQDALYAYKPTQEINSASGNGKYDEARIELHVTKGEKIYFVTDSTGNGHMCAHWIKSAGYLSVDSTFIVETDKAAYHENETITITTSVFEGKFSAEDVIRIVPLGQDRAVAEFAVSEVVTFTATPEQVPAGSYRVVLIHNGREVAAKEIRIVEEGLPTESRWDNGDLPMRCIDAGKRVFYGEDTPFGYAFFYEGTDPEDPRSAGFYDMVMAEAGDQDWPKGFYACGLNGNEVKDGIIDNRLNTLHQAAANAPTYHYSPGVVFTAPYDGTVRFVYQYAGLDSVEDKFTFYVMRDSAQFYEDALYRYKPAKAVSSADGSGAYDEATMEIGVRKGQKLYFVTDSTANGHMCAHWIKSAEYVSFETPDIQTSTTTRPKPADAGSGASEQRGPVTVFDGTAWESGDLLTHYRDTHSFYDAEGTPFGYAFYYEGTDPEDNRIKGFYPMQLSANQDGWSDGYYNCAMTPDETGFARVSTIHQAATNAPSYHYSPGFVFTAPSTGMVEFTYQFAKAYGGGGCEEHIIYVLRDVEDPYENGVIATFRPTAVISGEGAEAAGTPETQVFTVAVTEGEKIYFVIDNHDANGGMSAHWIKTAKYVSDELPAESDEPVETNPPMSEAPDDTITDNDPGAHDPADDTKAFPSAAVWGGIGLIAVIIAAVVVLIKKRKTAE